MELKKCPYIKQVLPWIILVIIELIIIIIMISRLQAKEVEIKTEYIKGDSVKVEIPAPFPQYIHTKIDTAKVLKYCVAHGLYKKYFPSDTVPVYLIDTVKVVSDWSAKVDYDLQLFDIDTVGTCSISTYVQYNRLGPIQTSFVPVTKVVTTRIPRKWEPFIGGGVSTQLEGSLYGGTFVNNWGFAVGYNKSLDINRTKDNWSLIVLKKF